MPLVAAAFALIFPALVLVAAGRDALSFTIPNWISAALALAFPLAALAVGMPLATMGLNVGVGAATLVAGMAMFAFRWIGGGDAKLLAAVALWLGWPAVITLGLGMGLAGGALAVLLLLIRSTQLRPFVLLGPGWMVRLSEPGEGVPYGVAIAVGALAAFPHTPFVAALGL